MSKGNKSDEWANYGDGIVDPLNKCRQPGEEIDSVGSNFDGITNIENVKDIQEDFRDSFEKCIIENEK